MQFHGIAGRIGRGITGSSSTKPKTKKIDLTNKDIAKVNIVTHQFPSAVNT